MKARKLQQLAIAIITLSVFGGCQKKPPLPPNSEQVAEETIKRIVLILNKSGDDTVRYQNDAALKDAIRRRVEASKSIKSLDDLAPYGSGVSVKEIQDTALREQFLPTKMREELNRIAQDIESPDAIDLGAAVVDAHCEGLKQELATGEPSTIMDYIVHFIIALVKSNKPTPPDKQIKEVADDLVKIAKDIHAQTINEAARRAYVKDMCNIPVLLENSNSPKKIWDAANSQEKP